MIQLTVRRVGNSLGVILPAEAAQTLRVKAGNKLFLTEAPGGFRLAPYNPGFEETMKAAEGFMARYKHALRKLAE